MKRIFLAIELPGPVKEKIFNVISELKIDYKWVKQEQMHLTLVFLGDTADRDIDALAESLESISFKPFELELGRLGFFSRKNIAQILWIDVWGKDSLVELYRILNEKILSLGLPLESRKYKPHITIGRSKRAQTHDVKERLLKTQGFVQKQWMNCKFIVDRFILFSSRLAPEGAIHTKEAQFPSQNR